MIRRFLPESLLASYHKALSLISSWYYRHPSDKLIVIGVTGTNGKSTVSEMISKILEASGVRVGLASTVKFKVADREWLNSKKMTMLGRFALQKLLSEMVSSRCDYAIIETTSQGIDQFRHLGINYDVVVFTNLTPEHIEAHKGFENYKKAKGKLFEHLMARPQKIINKNRISKIIVANVDDEHADYFLSFPADRKYGYGRSSMKIDLTSIIGERISFDKAGSKFYVQEQEFEMPLAGMFNVYNALAAISVARAFDIGWEMIRAGLKIFHGVAGRCEFIDEGQSFSVIVDYAHEPCALRSIYEFVELLKPSRVIHVLGSCGGGRDKARRPEMGRIAALKADIVIITNEDPYDEDPRSIMDQVASGAYSVLDVKNHDRVRIIEDRGEAISMAINLATAPEDCVLITGKGSEQAIVVAGGRHLAWDDRVVARKALCKKLLTDQLV